MHLLFKGILLCIDYIFHSSFFGICKIEKCKASLFIHESLFFELYKRSKERLQDLQGQGVESTIDSFHHITPGISTLCCHGAF